MARTRLGLSTFDGQLLDGLEFCGLVYNLHDQVRRSRSGITTLRLRSTVTAKKLLEELIPIARFIQARYQQGRRIRVRWHRGSQPFDAELLSLGGLVSHGMARRRQLIEVTTAVHPNDYLSREQLDATGMTWGAKNIRRDKRTREIVSEPFYAERFHRELVLLMKVEALILPVVRAIVGFDSQQLYDDLTTVKSDTGAISHRDAARKRIRMSCETQIIPNLARVDAPTQPKGEPVLAAAVFAKTPSYFQRTLLQANGCYENRWFEASSVMIRKLVENLIIDVYEKHAKQAEIQKDGEYFMLAGLVTAILNQAHWPLQRETKQALPEIKKLGDRAAHNRRYWANQQDIDKILPGLRAAVDDLLHLAGHK